MMSFSEHFNETLTLFSKMLPEYFDGAHAAKHDPCKQRSHDKNQTLFSGAVQFGSSSKTAKNPGYSPETAKILESGPLRYEMELYNLCKKIFYERLKYYQVSFPKCQWLNSSFRSSWEKKLFSTNQSTRNLFLDMFIFVIDDFLMSKNYIPA